MALITAETREHHLDRPAITAAWAAADQDAAPIILCLGMFGSASTWLFNVVLALARRHHGADQVAGFYADTIDNFPPLAETARAIVLKSHAPARSLRFLLSSKRAVALMTIRDPRDAAASLMRRFNFPFARARDAIVGSAQHLGAIAPPDILLKLRFEDRFYQHAGTVSRIAAWLGMPCSDAAAWDIARDFGEDQTPGRLRALEAEGAFANNDPDHADAATLLHRGHFGDRVIGKYRDVMTQAQHCEIAAETAKFAARNGYEDATIRLGRSGTLDFGAEGGGLGATLLYGFSAPEGGGVWTIDSQACLELDFHEPIRERLELELAFTPCVCADPPRAIRGSVRADHADPVAFAYPPAEKSPECISIAIPATHLRTPLAASIEFQFPGIRSLKETGINPDERRLGVLLRTLSFSAR